MQIRDGLSYSSHWYYGLRPDSVSEPKPLVNDGPGACKEVVNA